MVKKKKGQSPNPVFAFSPRLQRRHNTCALTSKVPLYLSTSSPCLGILPLLVRLKSRCVANRPISAISSSPINAEQQLRSKQNVWQRLKPRKIVRNEASTEYDSWDDFNDLKDSDMLRQSFAGDYLEDLRFAYKDSDHESL